jgi:hypothetical protein
MITEWEAETICDGSWAAIASRSRLRAWTKRSIGFVIFITLILACAT